MPSGSKSLRTIVRIRPRLFKGLEELAPRQPSLLIYRSTPCLEMVFNAPLTEEEKDKLKAEIRDRYGDEFEVEVLDEEVEKA